MSEIERRKTERKHPNRRSLNMDERILKAGERLAKSKRRSFNNYVEDLIAQDIAAAKIEGVAR
jgi:hypothetical protein